MAQQILNRPVDGTNNSRTGNSNVIRSERPQSSSSEIELTSDKARPGQGITKTLAWETSTAVHQDDWSNGSGQERYSQEVFRSGNVVSVESKPSHG